MKCPNTCILLAIIAVSLSCGGERKPLQYKEPLDDRYKQWPDGSARFPPPNNFGTVVSMDKFRGMCSKLGAEVEISERTEAWFCGDRPNSADFRDPANLLPPVNHRNYQIVQYRTSKYKEKHIFSSATACKKTDTDLYTLIDVLLEKYGKPIGSTEDCLKYAEIFKNSEAYCEKGAAVHTRGIHGSIAYNVFDSGHHYNVFFFVKDFSSSGRRVCVTMKYEDITLQSKIDLQDEL